MFDQSIKLTVGGDVQSTNGTYLLRPADDALFYACMAREFAYILASRQVGKSSLKNAVAERLIARGYRVARIDLNRIGQNVGHAEVWYFTILDELCRNLRLETDVEAWWDSKPKSLSNSHRFLRFLEEVVLTEIVEPVVIFVDEIDMTLGLPFTDDFFAAIRGVHSERAQKNSFQRLTFVLLGVATPDELITDYKRTPFNIGHAITLRDFTVTECAPLRSAIEARHPERGRVYFDRIYDWTNGHPYLTQKLCQATVDNAATDDPYLVDNLVSKIFFSEASNSEVNIRFVQERVLNDPNCKQMLRVYQKILQNKSVRDDELSTAINRLKLYGLVVAENGKLRVRNKLYSVVLNLSWAKEHIPVNYLRVLVTITAVILLLILGIGSIFYWYP